MEPSWLQLVGWLALGAGFASAAAIALDIVALGRRQAMWVMNVVHPVTALYFGPLWLWAYLTRGRRLATPELESDAARLATEGGNPDALRRAVRSDFRSWHVAAAVSHCGAGCTLGDIGGEWIVFALGSPTLGATGTYGPEIIADFVLAWTLGIAFQYFTIVPMRSDVGPLQGLWLAARADTLSIVSFQVGLFGWMALSHFVLWRPPLPVDTSGHWFMMQIGMIVGFATAWPVNAWLIRRGWKEKMDRRTHLAAVLEQAG
jgi:hypothetical protein